VGVKPELDTFGNESSRPPNRLVDFCWHRRSGGILEAYGMIGDVRVEDPAQHRLVELRVVRSGGPRRKLHHRNDHFMPEAGLRYALSAVHEVLDVVQGVEVADGGDTVFPEELRVQLDDVAALGVQADDVHPPGQRLEVRVGSGCSPKAIHHVEGIFIAKEVEGLEPGAPACFKVRDAGFPCGLDGRKEVVHEDASPEDRLEAVPECRVHNLHLALADSDRHRFHHPLSNMVAPVIRIRIRRCGGELRVLRSQRRYAR